MSIPADESHVDTTADIVDGSSVASIDECRIRLVDPEKVQAVRDARPDPEAVADLAAIFSLLGDPNRLRLLTSLLEAGELCVCDLAAVTDLSESSVSHSLRLLRAHRVVSVNRRGRMAYYRLQDSHVRMLLDLGFLHRDHAPGTQPTAD